MNRRPMKIGRCRAEVPLGPLPKHRVPVEDFYVLELLFHDPPGFGDLVGEVCRKSGHPDLQLIAYFVDSGVKVLRSG